MFERSAVMVGVLWSCGAGLTSCTPFSSFDGLSVATCDGSDPSFRNHPLPAQAGRFSVEFDATPQAAGIESITGFSGGPVSTFYDINFDIRFSPAGIIHAVDGEGFSPEILGYEAEKTYHFQLNVDLNAQTYTVTITPLGGTKVVGSRYALYNVQPGMEVQTIDNWVTWAGSGGHQTCNLWVRP